MRLRLSFVLVVLTALCLCAPVAFSTTIHVPADQPTIQAGIDAAANGDTVLVAPGTYTGDGNRDIDPRGKSITIRSENGPLTTIIDCQGTVDDRYRGFYIRSGEDSLCIIDGFTIQNGTGAYSDKGGPNGGAILAIGSSFTIKNCRLQFNWALYGGALAVLGKSNVRILGCTFDHNTSEFAGGALLLEDSIDANIEGCMFIQNDGGHGIGGMTCANSKVRLCRCSFYGNIGPDAAGALLLFQSQIQILQCTIVGNRGGDGGVQFSCANLR